MLIILRMFDIQLVYTIYVKNGEFKDVSCNHPYLLLYRTDFTMLTFWKEQLKPFSNSCFFQKVFKF